MITLDEGEVVELTGIAHLIGDPQLAPLTGESCLGCISRARVFTRLDLAGNLVEIFETSQFAPFTRRMLRLATATTP